MVPLPALLAALLACQLAGVVLGPHRQLGRFHGHAGLGACVQVAEQPWCPAGAHCSAAGPRALSVSPLRAEGDVGGCDGGIPGSQSLQVHTAVRDVLRKCPTETWQRRVSGFLLQPDAASEDFGEQTADEQLPLGTSEPA